MIKKYKPQFVELKGFMSVGFARERIGYDKMPWHEDILKFAKELSTATGLEVLEEHERSRAVVLGKSREELKIKQN